MSFSFVNDIVEHLVGLGGNRVLRSRADLRWQVWCRHRSRFPSPARRESPCCHVYLSFSSAFCFSRRTTNAAEWSAIVLFRAGLGSSMPAMDRNSAREILGAFLLAEWKMRPYPLDEFCASQLCRAFHMECTRPSRPNRYALASDALLGDISVRVAS